VIWEPFVLALVLGLIVSAGLYFAYLWPSVEPLEDEAAPAEAASAEPAPAEPAPADAAPIGPPTAAEPASEEATAT
jgi:hypothetical protein